MEVTLLHYTPIESLVKATALPYESKESSGLVSRVFKSGHKSIARHGMASFFIEGVSQSLLRQLSRHQHLNLTVKSTRYCDMSNAQHYTPDKLTDGVRADFNEDIDEIMGIYRAWKKHYEGGEKEVDVAKLLLPLASTTDLVVSGNYQALYEMLQLRNCVRVEEEFRKLSREMSNILQGILPEIFTQDFGCIGDEWHICPENKHMACGKYITKQEYKRGN